ncbi:MAG: aldo/keto reductase [Armatimonadota bacterium]|nr:aldo/keto reductase [Armatimonadota bacterium]
MEYRTLGGCGMKVSELCLGTMMFGGPTDEETSLRMIGTALDAGINFLDTADKYNAGESERVVGKALQGKREEIVLATKVTLPMGDGPNQMGSSRKHIMEGCEASLRRLGTDYIDLYYLHKPDPDTPIEESLSAMNDLVRQGKVLYVGLSNFAAWRVADAVGVQALHGWDRLAAVQPLYNIANRDIEVELLPACDELRLGVVTYSPIARGVLTGKYAQHQEPPPESRAGRGNERLMQTEYRPSNLELAQQVVALAEEVGCTAAQLAVAWAMANELVTCPIIGPRTPEQLQDNLGALEVEVTPEIEARIDELVPPGEHCGFGFQDPVFPVTGRKARC